MSYPYSDLECEIIRECWAARLSIPDICTQLKERAGTKRTRLGIIAKTSNMGLTTTRGLTPSKEAWRAAAVRAAEASGIPLISIMGTDKRPKAVQARWQAWKELHDQGFGLAAIGRRVGVDHSSIFHARNKNFEAEMWNGETKRGKHPNCLAVLVVGRALRWPSEEVR